MCLYVDKAATSNLKKRRGELISCYKLFNYRCHKYSSPYQGVVVNLNTNCLSVEKIRKKPSSYIKQRGYWSRGPVVEEGIHAYRSRITATHKDYGRRVVVKCYGYKEDLIAVGNLDIAFTKLYIDEEDYQEMLDNVYGKGKYTYADL